jgi:peptidoglycan/xylan/chitin deacetylase (PgdA/CDA1 family)
MYHRIADEPIDNWNLSVSPAHFEEQLHVLRRKRHHFALADFVQKLMAGTLPSDAVALTFDDGYADNLTAGKPRLAAADVPATVFLATGFLDRPGEFWWDELARLILLENGPRSFKLVVGGETVHFDLDNELLEHKDGTVRGGPSTTRKATLRKIWQAIRLLEEKERESIMLELRSIFSTGDCADRGRALTREEVRELAQGGLVTIGAHTVTHPILSELSADACLREITESKLACETVTGEPTAGFTYPYGDLNDKARDAVISAGFTFACSTQHKPTVVTSDIFALPRIQVHNWNGDAFERALRSASAYS